MNLGGKNDDEKVELLLQAIQNLMRELEIPTSLKDMGISEEDFNAKLDEIVELAFDDQCTGANPVYPLMADIKDIYVKAYNGII